MAASEAHASDYHAAGSEGRRPRADAKGEAIKVEGRAGWTTCTHQEKRIKDNASGKLVWSEVQSSPLMITINDDPVVDTAFDAD